LRFIRRIWRRNFIAAAQARRSFRRGLPPISWDRSAGRHFFRRCWSIRQGKCSRRRRRGWCPNFSASWHAGRESPSTSVTELGSRR